MAKNAIFIRGLRGVMDDQAAIDWSELHQLDLKIFNWNISKNITDYILLLKEPIDLIGFSKGAEVAYSVAASLTNVKFDRLITVGAYYTVTASFGTKRRPKLSNVKTHWNFSEDFQQPAGFHDNPINVDLGSVTHFNSLKKALKTLDNM